MKKIMVCFHRYAILLTIFICICRAFIGLNLIILNDELASVVVKYYHIGLRLGIPDYKLEEFEGDYHFGRRRFSAVLSHWWKGNTKKPVEWESIFKALESPSVDEKGLAKYLREKYGTTHVQGCYITKYINLVIVIILTPFFFSYSQQQIRYQAEFLF